MIIVIMALRIKILRSRPTDLRVRHFRIDMNVILRFIIFGSCVGVIRFLCLN